MNIQKTPIAMTLVLASSMIITSCATTPPPPPPRAIGNSTTALTINAGMDIARSVLQTAINVKCQAKLENSTVWKTARLVMTFDKQNQVKQNVCSCVGMYGTQSVTLDQLLVAATSPQARDTLVSNSVSNAFQNCYGEAMRSIMQ